MRILFVSNVFPNPLAPTKGPFNFALLKALAAEHSVHVVSPVPWVERLTAKARHRRPLTPGITNLADQLTARYPVYFYPPKILRSYYGRFLEWSIRGVLDQDVKQFQPDAIVSYWVHPDGEVAVNAARRAGIPSVTMVGGSDVLLLARAGKRRGAVLNVLHQTDAIITVSEHLAECMRGDGISGSKIHVVRRGVNRDLFRAGDRAASRQRLGIPLDRQVLVAVGRLVPVKGFSVLIDACSRLVRQNVPVLCYIVGAGPLAGSLIEQIHELGLGQHVILAGSQPQEALPDWYRAADLTVLSSLSEGVPNVLLESIACRTRFVASDVGGVTEIADPRAHQVVPPRDAAALADAIAAQLRQKTTPERLRFEPQSWLDSAHQLVRIIDGCQTRKSVLEPLPAARNGSSPACESLNYLDPVCANNSRTQPELSPSILRPLGDGA